MTLTVVVGNCLEKLREMKAKSVHTVICSPPYWGLRDYGIEPSVWGGAEDFCEHDFSCEVVTGELRRGTGMEALGAKHRGGGKKAAKVEAISAVTGTCRHCGAWRGAFGLEPSPDLFVEHLVMIFAEVHRVLRDDGTLWMNLGDSYYSPRYPGGVGENSTINGQDGQEELRKARRLQRGGFTGNKGYVQGNAHEPHRSSSLQGLKAKDLVGVPWMAAFALRRWGWYLRQEIIWHKPNPMPESMQDRCTKAHEQIFLLAKSEQYFYDGEAIKEPTTGDGEDRPTFCGGAFVHDGTFVNAEGGRSTVRGNKRRQSVAKGGFNGKRGAGDETMEAPFRAVTDIRNKRSVWTVATAPFQEAHFATFPPALIEPCVKAGTSERGCCPACAAPWQRITGKVDTGFKQKMADGWDTGAGGHSTIHREGRQKGEADVPVLATVTLGWWPICRCDALPLLPLYPRKPPRSQFDEDATGEAEYKTAIAYWTGECRSVDWTRKRMCEAQIGRVTVPAVVLDPFGGAFTTAVVADLLGRDSVMIEMNPSYAAMGTARVEAARMTKENGKRHMARAVGKEPSEALPLFR